MNCGSSHQHRQCPAYGKNCKTCGKKNHFGKKCRSGKGQGQGQSSGGAKHKSFKYREVNLDQESSDDQIDEITSKVKSMYYHDVHFNSVNTRMHINVNTKSCNGNSMKTHFKVDTGADGNLLPLGEFFKHSPGVNLTIPSLFTHIYTCNFYLSTGRFIESLPTVCTQQCFKSIYLCIMLLVTFVVQDEQVKE